MEEKPTGNFVVENFIKEIKLDNLEYQKLFTKYPGLINIPFFNKDGPLMSPSERLIVKIEYLDIAISLTGKVKNKKGEILDGTHPLISGSGVPEAWILLITTERVLAYIRGRNLGAGLLAKIGRASCRERV